MEFVEFQANEIYEEVTLDGLNYQKTLNHVREQADNFDVRGKIEVLEKIRDKFQGAYDEHLKECTEENPNECGTNKKYMKILYFLNQDITSKQQALATTVPEGKSDFTAKERAEADDRIDQILQELNELKTGQEIIWTDLTNELNELKEMYYLNKKHWRQLFVGKLAEMVGAGIVSETISKKIADTINPLYNQLLG